MVEEGQSLARGHTSGILIHNSLGLAPESKAHALNLEPHCLVVVMVG